MEQQLAYILNILWGVLKNWWWLPLPFLLYRPFLFLWLWWRREIWLKSQKFVLLEIKMPKDVLKPLRAMEQVFSAIWGNIYDPPDWWEKWIEGKMLLGIGLEIISLEGKPHLLIRIPESRRNAVESSIYSQYPEAEISLFEDYTKYVPQNIPNRDWDLWGTDYELVKPDVYPIKTYSKFFEERPETLREEKRIDPMATLLEGMGTLKPGEQLWIQISATPATSSKDEPVGDFVARGRAIADQLAKRPTPAKSKSILQEAVEELVSGKIPGQEEKKPEPIIPPEMKLTPGEREILAAVEGKISRRGFSCYIRFIYLAKREVLDPGAKTIPFGFFNQFSTENLNTLKPWPKTITKIHKYPFINFLLPRRLFTRKRRIFRNYIKRLPPLFPQPGGTFLLDTEELATIFHFPGQMVAPASFLSRLEAKKGRPPSDLPGS